MEPYSTDYYRERAEGSGAGGCRRSGLLVGAGILIGAAATAAVILSGLLPWAPPGPGAGPLPAVTTIVVPAGATAVAQAPQPTRPPQPIGGAAPGRRLVWQAPLALAGETGEPDLLVISRNYDAAPSSDSLIYLRPDTAEVLWESPTLGEEGNRWLLAAGREVIALADGARLVGIGRADGAISWEARLSDEIQYSLCEGCLQVSGDTVVALSADGVIQAFELASGAPRWSHRLRETPRQLLILGDRVAAPDALAEGSDAGLFLFDLASGQERGAIEPSCVIDPFFGEERPSIYDPVFRSPDGASLYWMLDTFGTCVVQADAASGAIGWASVLPDELRNVSVDPLDVQFGPDGTIFMSTDELIVQIDRDGQASPLLGDEDYFLRPLAASADTLLLAATRTRGTRRLELWGVDLGGQGRLWQRVLASEDLLEGPRDSGELAVALQGDGALLLEQIDDERLRFSRLDLRDGAALAERDLAVDDPGELIRGVTVGSEALFVAAGELYGVGSADGQIRWRWP